MLPFMGLCSYPRSGVGMYSGPPSRSVRMGTRAIPGIAWHLSGDYNHDHSHIEFPSMQTIKASEFKSHCLRLMDEVNETGEEIVITKNGHPVSLLVPYRQPASSLFGCSQNVISSKDDLIEPVGEDWDAD